MIKINKIVLFGIIIIFFSGMLFALGGKEDTSQSEKQTTAGKIYKNAANGKMVTITGRLHLVGSDPFPETVITDEAGNDWYIAEDGRKTLSRYEQQTITVQGTVELREMILANGRSLGFRRILHKVSFVQP